MCASLFYRGLMVARLCWCVCARRLGLSKRASSHEKIGIGPRKLRLRFVLLQQQSQGHWHHLVPKFTHRKLKFHKKKKNETTQNKEANVYYYYAVVNRNKVPLEIYKLLLHIYSKKKCKKAFNYFMRLSDLNRENLPRN